MPLPSPTPSDGPLPLIAVPGMLCDASLWSDVGFPDGHPVHHVALTEPSVGELADSVLSATTGRFVLVGLSLGAIVGFEVVRRAPERVAGLCLVSTNAGAPRPEQYAAWRALDELAGEGRFDAVVERTLPGMFARDPAPDRLAERYRRMARSVGARAARAQLAAQATRRDAHAALRTARCPTAVVCGTRDALCPPGYHRAIADAVPGARLHAVPDAGHLLPWERPDALTSVLDGLVTAAQAGRRLARAGRPLRSTALTPPLPSLRTKEPPCHTT
ncbi:alpha/beta fold hydrolase [Streptomyces thinghirensis]|uniref:Alpha/beta fold hydrolase n=1 Tax=Streptomyces thinghirensis TaxID=551547 RepID=A0ABP9T326_9ACTN